MAVMKIVVLDGRALNPGDLSWDALRALGELQLFDRTADDQIVARAHEAEIVLTNKTRLSAQILKQLTKTRYIGILATGYDVVDLLAARELKIPVTNIPTYGTDSVAAVHLCAAPGAMPSRGRSRRCDLCGRVVAIRGLQLLENAVDRASG